MPDSYHPELIAFYLPQFHPIEENDIWWGRGFTEWTNITKSQSLFAGHIQPRLPADLGFYDLRLPETREAQADLARRAGISAFCYYYYWFDGRRLLERPLNEVIASGRPDFPFCICWANESWTRRWDGLDQEVLIAQDYTNTDPERFIRDLLPALQDSRYFRINGKALLLVYRPESVREIKRWADIWRAFAHANGAGELMLCGVQSFAQDPPESLGFDAAVEFPPLGPILERSLLAPSEVAVLIGTESNFQGLIANYPRFAQMAAEAPPPPFRRFRCVAPSWDNTPRRKNRALIFKGANPDDYEHWLKAALQHTLHEQPPGERLVFINAWNEWAEGCHLEPDVVWKDRYLRATRAALISVKHLHKQSKDGRAPQELMELLTTRERSIRALTAELRSRDKTISDLRRRLAEADLAASSIAVSTSNFANRCQVEKRHTAPGTSADKRLPTAIIFGAGKGGERVLRLLRDSWDIIAFVDNDKNKHGSTIEGVHIAPPEFVDKNESTVIFIASMYADEIQTQLLTTGVLRSRIRHISPQILLGAEPINTDPLRKLDVIIFGTGNGGQRAYLCLPTECRVVAFADNDTAKIGLSLCGYPIIEPAEIPSWEFDHIIVASMYAEEIIPQLEHLGVASHRIEVVNRNILIGKNEAEDQG
jgi:hypothetical protein